MFFSQFSKQAQWLTLGGCGYLSPDDCFGRLSPCELCVDWTEICKTQRKIGFKIHLSPQNFLNTYLYNVFLIPVTLLNSLYTSSQQPGKACRAASSQEDEAEEKEKKLSNLRLSARA